MGLAWPASTSSRHRQGLPRSCGVVGLAATVAVVGAIAPTAAALSSCWINGYSRERCCDKQHGPTGNRECWDGIFGYEPCCTKPDVNDGEDNDDITQSLEVLEHSLGAKLDGTLQGNNMTLEELEDDLRLTIRSPENRSMAGPMTHAFLALLLYRQGRSSEAAESFRKFNANDFTIAANGAWIGNSAEGYHMHDVPFSTALVDFFATRGASSIVDFGCGLGMYVRDLRTAGFRAGGFDGNPSTVEITEGRCNHIDLSRDVDFGNRWHWAMSLEVAEHIPPEFESTFVGNLDRHACAGIVLSWGNQAGEGHVNLRTRSEVEEIFAQRGFRCDHGAGEALRDAARLPWLRNTVMVFVRDPSLFDCEKAKVGAFASSSAEE